MKRLLPDGLRDKTSTHLMVREMELPPGLSDQGRDVARQLRNASRGIPNSPEQENRWRKLGLAP